MARPTSWAVQLPLAAWILSRTCLPVQIQSIPMPRNGARIRRPGRFLRAPAWLGLRSLPRLYRGYPTGMWTWFHWTWSMRLSGRRRWRARILPTMRSVSGPWSTLASRCGIGPAVNTNLVQLFLDSNLVSPSIQKVETNTLVQYAAGLLTALSPHTYRIVFSDNGTPVTTQTNEFRFTVADYLTLPTTLRSPLGSEDTTKPGFNVNVYQVDTLPVTDPPTVQVDLPASIGFSEAVLAGLVGPNVANLAGAAAGNTFEVPGVVNWINISGATANFPDDKPFPGIPGTSGSEFSFVHEVRAFVKFPASGYYQMGINNEDQF